MIVQKHETTVSGTTKEIKVSPQGRKTILGWGVSGQGVTEDDIEIISIKANGVPIVDDSGADYGLTMQALKGRNNGGWRTLSSTFVLGKGFSGDVIFRIKQTSGAGAEICAGLEVV